jgi:hypothetical protein
MTGQVSDVEVTGEPRDTETVTRGSERGRWKSTHQGNSLASYSTARTVLKTSGRGDPLAEFNRALRFGVLLRKRSNGTASVKGNRWVERSLSLRQTCRQLGQSTFSVLVEALNCGFAGRQLDLAWLY